MEKHCAVFVTEGNSLIGISDERNFSWIEFSWLFDHYFLSCLQDSLAPHYTTKVVFNDKQIPVSWATGEHYLFSYEEFFVLLTQFLRSKPLIDKDKNDFCAFYWYSIMSSMEKIRALRSHLRGMYRIVPDEEIYVILAMKVVPQRKKHLKAVFDFWEENVPKLEDLLKIEKNEAITPTNQNK